MVTPEEYVASLSAFEFGKHFHLCCGLTCPIVADCREILNQKLKFFNVFRIRASVNQGMKAFTL